MQLDRRSFLNTCGTAWLTTAGAEARQPGAATSTAGVDVTGWRREFPALTQVVEGHPLAYLDSAATTLRPRAVIEAVAEFSATDNANPGAALHSLARRSALRYGAARARIAAHLHAAHANEVVLTKGTTEAINLVASTWGRAHVRRGDEIVLTIAEHYSNLLPWRALAAEVGARIVTVEVDDEGRLHPERIERALTPRTRLIAFSHVSNVLGLVNPAEAICRLAKSKGIAVLVDAAQSAPHLALDVQSLGCDFLACSGHKLLGPMGTGVLWAGQATLDAMPAYHHGSNMAHEVEATSLQLEPGASKYQAGTPNVSGAVGLAAAIDTLHRFDLAAIRQHDATLVRHFAQRAGAVPGLRVLGALDDAQTRLPVFTFVLPGVSAATVVRSLDTQGIAVRAGDMAALPLLKRFGTSEAVRASCYLYTTTEEIDRLIDGLREIAGTRR